MSVFQSYNTSSSMNTLLLSVCKSVSANELPWTSCLPGMWVCRQGQYLWGVVSECGAPEGGMFFLSYLNSRLEIPKFFPSRDPLVRGTCTKATPGSNNHENHISL